MIDLLVPDQSRLRVGWIEPRRQVRGCHMALRALRPTDPPAVLAYPLLLAQRFPGAVV